MEGCVEVRAGVGPGMEGRHLVPVVGDGRRWDQVRFNRFPSRAAFMAVVFDPSRLEVQHEHREVAMSDTYTLIVRPQIDTLPASWEGLVDG